MNPRKIRVALFSGGSGTKSITEALLRHRQIELTILINAYDDGHSTGRLRRFVPGMLGPSDVRKNLARVMTRDDRCYEALASFSDYRLPKGCDHATGSKVVQALVNKACAALPPKLAELYRELRWDHTEHIAKWCSDFLKYSETHATNGEHFDFNDCAIGNIIFAGCYLTENSDFNRTISALSQVYSARARIVNVTQGENLFLIAVKEDGSVLRNEADIVSQQTTTRISRILLLDQQAYRGPFENGSMPDSAAFSFATQANKFPELSAEARTTIADADVIIYGPGTQHSSLFPSYLTRGIAETIALNQRADKIFVCNTRRDFDIQDDDAGSIASRFMQCMGRYGEITPSSKDLVTHFFLQQGTEDGGRRAENQVPFNASSFPFRESNLVLMDWETHEGYHAGGRVLEELQAIIQPKVEVVLESIHHMVSIVMPALNEEKTIERVLKHLLAMDFTPINLSKEIIVVDGGSSDRTAEIAGALPGVQVIKLKTNLGRGAALRAGIARAKGNIVLFFPADDEYRSQDLVPIIDSFSRGKFKVVFGSRAIKCVNLNERISDIYGNNWLGYLLSKYGGMLLSTTTLLFYNRYVADPLTSVKAFDGQMLRSFSLKSSGVDLEMELIAKVIKNHQFILEMPVDYKPRTKLAGKKTTAWEGIKALWALFIYRFRN